MKLKIKSLLSFLLIFAVQVLFAQGADVEMADGMRASGKIYVVVAVIVTIFIGLIAYLVSTDRKITKLENEINASK